MGMLDADVNLEPEERRRSLSCAASSSNAHLRGMASLCWLFIH